MAWDRGEAHPIDSKNLEEAVKYSKGHAGSIELSTPELSDALIYLQNRLQNNLNELIRERQEEGTWDTLSERLNAFNEFYINTYDYLLLENLSTDPDYFLNTFEESTGIPENDPLQKAVLEAHRLQFTEFTESRNL